MFAGMAPVSLMRGASGHQGTVQHGQWPLGDGSGSFWTFLPASFANYKVYTCIFQRAWISAWPQISACGGNWKLRRKVILSIFWGILIRSWWTIQVKRNALRVMFAVFLFWFLIFIFFFGRKHPRNGRKHPRNRRKHPKWDFHVKQ